MGTRGPGPPGFHVCRRRPWQPLPCPGGGSSGSSGETQAVSAAPQPGKPRPPAPGNTEQHCTGQSQHAPEDARGEKRRGVRRGVGGPPISTAAACLLHPGDFLKEGWGVG